MTPSSESVVVKDDPDLHLLSGQAGHIAPATQANAPRRPDLIDCHNKNLSQMTETEGIRREERFLQKDQKNLHLVESRRSGFTADPCSLCIRSRTCRVPACRPPLLATPLTLDITPVTPCDKVSPVKINDVSRNLSLMDWK